jgi:hypothetical protein
LLSVLALLSSCESGSDIINGGPSGFHIAALEWDSVYWGEKVTVTVKNAPSDSLQTFIHTSAIAIDTSWSDGLNTRRFSFRVPSDSPSGRLRIYSGTSEASVPLTVLGRMPKIRAIRFSPNEGYVGDLLVVRIDNFLLNQLRYIDVSIGEVPLQIESWDTITVMCRVPPQVKSGEVRVRLFNDTYRLDTFYRIDHHAAFLKEGQVSSIVVYPDGMLGTTISHDTGATVVTATLHYNYAGDKLNPTWGLKTAAQRIGDSIICINDISSSTRVQRLELRLRLEPESRVSGIVRVLDSVHALPRERRTLDLAVNSMRWKTVGEKYILYTQGSDLQKELVSLEHSYAYYYDRLFSSSRYTGVVRGLHGLVGQVSYGPKFFVEITP